MGTPVYSKGKPCHRCGTDERLVSTGRCRPCGQRYSQQYKRTAADRDLRRGDPCDSCGDVMDEPCFDEVDGTCRGWLCHHCNLALGHLRESLERTDALRSYLARTLGATQQLSARPIHG